MNLVRLPEAIRRAVEAANTTRLPQTVYKTSETCGWANTHSLARVLDHPKTRVHVTMLGARYFPGACAESAEQEAEIIARCREQWGLYEKKT